jgi:predicted secreted protein
MPSQKGRDLRLKIGDGGDPEIFTAIGAARGVMMAVVNHPADATEMGGGGAEALAGAGGVQAMRVRLDGVFRDTGAEELLRAAAFGRAAANFEIGFPNGDVYAASFVVEEYARGGSHEGVEDFSVTLRRSGGGTFTAGA